MAKANVGDRVIALRNTNNESKTAYIYGAGTYQGELVPEHDSFFKTVGMKNPAIKLDSGKMVYGFECWWGPEDAMRNKFPGFNFVEVDIDDDRKEADDQGEPV